MPIINPEMFERINWMFKQIIIGIVEYNINWKK